MTFVNVGVENANVVIHYNGHRLGQPIALLHCYLLVYRPVPGRAPGPRPHRRPDRGLLLIASTSGGTAIGIALVVKL